MKNIDDIENYNIKILIEEFLTYTLSIEDKKVNILKQYYYNWASQFLKINDIQDFKIGSNKNKILLFFYSIKEPNKYLILKLDSNSYFIYNNELKQNMIPSTNNNYIKLNSYNKDFKNYQCFKICSIQ